jgi:chromosome condensin MukBEF MukE localization factor
LFSFVTLFRLSENQSVFAEGADVRVGDGKEAQKKVHGGQRL